MLRALFELVMHHFTTPRALRMMREHGVIRYIDAMIFYHASYHQRMIDRILSADIEDHNLMAPYHVVLHGDSGNASVYLKEQFINDFGSFGEGFEAALRYAEARRSALIMGARL